MLKLGFLELGQGSSDCLRMPDDPPAGRGRSPRFLLSALSKSSSSSHCCQRCFDAGSCQLHSENIGRRWKRKWPRFRDILFYLLTWTWLTVIGSLELCFNFFRGIDLGHRLITSATAEMQNDVSLTNVTQFSSLSPVPGFRRWILKMMDSDQSALGNVKKIFEIANILSVETIGAENYSDFRELVASLDPQLLPKFSNSLPKLLFKYLFAEKGPDNSTVCPVCNFHVRNGAELWRLNFSANTAQYGMSESLSMMVNYRYYTDKMWQNSYDYQVQKIIPISYSVRSTFLEK